ncbi:uncharacterized protein ACLA_050210 [Aspergillus clavatus NRRL 1]|uniref:Uncharacterized protein n=1 Tax=Aspergillus clavatus (strain ATCC 1007 / CBS 513.65 / DSM 816 / NCTC 3887 / NRRL 1 / QM 1276 / 107) TaxID=344612 RepID=A1CI44_ASPCL|nr:uncharacterized protein ACLA_050210 [Aspergillus clavatus NRRL 1]EAW10549.1 conserved hypothetical protein [Aspergillus clavatus NRRL 1]
MLAASMPPVLSHLHPSSDARPQSCQTAVNSTNMSCGGVSSTAAGDRRATIPARPKLTLQTKSLPITFGSSSTGLSLSLAAGVTASPTVRNTFRNAYDVSCPSSATVSPSKSFNPRFSKPSSPYPSSATGNPYQQPIGVKSILRNSPLEPTARRRSISVATNGPTGGPSSRRVFFPAERRVSYRYPLEEEIKTVHYVARHSDLANEVMPEPITRDDPSSGSGEDSDSTSSLASSDTSSSDNDDRDPSAPPRQRKKRKPAGAERQVRAVALLDGLEADHYSGASTPQTPRQHRAKRRCEWRWTLGPLDKRNELIQLPQTPNDVGSTVLTTATTSSAAGASKQVDKDTESSESSDSEKDYTPASARLSSPTSSVASHHDNIERFQSPKVHEPESEPPPLVLYNHGRHFAFDDLID